MTSDQSLRKQLVAYLKQGHAHSPLEDIVADFPVNKINIKAPNSSYTPYRLLEHIRITQWDILDFIRNPKYKYMKWPNDYWRPENFKATKKDWDESVREFKKDLKALVLFVSNPKTDLLSKIPHGEGQTVLKEILVIIDHNAYHLGEFGILRDVMKTWGKNKKTV